MKNFRDFLAILMGVIVFPGMWLLAGLGIANFPENIIGATLVLEPLIVQFYFRKKETETPN